MSKIFLSYASSDAQIAQKIAQGLGQVGHQVWNADSEFEIGDTIEQSIYKSWREADAVIVIVTSKSIENRWVNAELGAFSGYFGDSGKPIILPVVFDQVQIPISLSRIKVLFADRDELDYVIKKLIIAIDQSIVKVKALIDEKRETHERVEKTAETYIDTTLKSLRSKESNYQRNAYICYGCALITLIVSIAIGIWRGYTLVNTNYVFAIQIQFTIMTLFVITLIIAVSRFMFLLGKSFMVEALRNADRIHAISFGKFYLNAYAENANWSEIKDVFQHWNIDSGSAFSSQSSSDYDPQVLKNLSELIKSITGSGK